MNGLRFGFIGRLLLAFAVTVAIFPSEARAQSYRFAVPEMKMQVFVNPDASVRVEYEIVFVNDRRGRTIDAVDVGLFHKDYDISRMTASVDGRPISDIGRSPYVNPGVEVKLGAHGIRAGERGVFRFVTTMPDLVYQDTTNDELASLRVTPTWFGEQFVSGSTNLEVAIHVPPGVEPEEVLYQDVAFTNKAFFQGRTVAYWQFTDTRATGAHMVGVSFPKRGMDRVVTMTKWKLLVLWWEGNPLAQLISGAIIMILFGFFFFRMTSWTGWSVFIVMIGVGLWIAVVNPVAHLISIPIWPFVFGMMWSLTSKLKSGRKKYLPPIASVEGGGIKRGLTAPEAAVLLEMRPGKLVTLVVFGLLKKKVVTMTNENPLTAALEKDFAGDRPARLAKSAEKGVILHAYEHAFLDAIGTGKSALMDIDLSDAIKGLIDHTVERVTGFDIKLTKAYYDGIIKRAWSEAESLGEVDQRSQAIDKNLEWMLMRDDANDRFTTWERSGYRYYPIWIGGRYRTGSVGSVGSGMGSAAGGAGGSGSSFTPSFGDVAGSFAGWTENVAGQAASAISPEGIGSRGGALDLSGFDKVTSDVFKAMGESGHGGGGGGGCACAGCACACACAGGGR